jgi:hypothetical protein
MECSRSVLRVYILCVYGARFIIVRSSLLWSPSVIRQLSIPAEERQLSLKRERRERRERPERPVMCRLYTM